MAPVGTKLITEITDHNAPLTDGHLWFDVMIVGDIAKVDSKLGEHVGSGKDRYVIFRATDDCTVHFRNKAVFDLTEQHLAKGKPQKLSISDNTNNADTGFWFEADSVSRSAGAINDGGIKGEPKIFVP